MQKLKKKEKGEKGKAGEKRTRGTPQGNGDVTASPTDRAL